MNRLLELVVNLIRFNLGIFIHSKRYLKIILQVQLIQLLQLVTMVLTEFNYSANILT